MSQSMLQRLVPRCKDAYFELRQLLNPGKISGKINNNLTIPNILRTTDWEMELYFEELTSTEIKRIKDLTTDMTNGILELHVITGSIFILSKDRLQKNELEFSSSWAISNEDLELFIRAVDEPSIVAVEYRKTPLADYNPKLWPQNGNLEEAQYNPTKEDFGHRKSFIRKHIEMDKINQYLLFMDAEFTIQMADESKAPVSITILDGNGTELMDTIITPRHRIIKLGDEYHGIKEIQLRRQYDEYAALKMVRELCRGKILVGHDLQMELNHLCIDKNSLLGIRDLAGTKTFRKYKVYPKADGQLYKLKTLAAKFLGRSIQQKGNHSSNEDTFAIMQIYRCIEEAYEDDFNCNHGSSMMQILKSSNINQPPLSKKRKGDSLTPVDPIDNLIAAWQKEIVDLDLEVFETQTATEILETAQTIPTLERFLQQELNPLVKVTSKMNISSNVCKIDLTEKTNKSLNSKPKLTICHLEHIDCPPKPVKIIYPELIINGETFTTQLTYIPYKNEDGQTVIWKL